LQSLLFFPKIKKQVLVADAEVKGPKDINENTMFWVNQEFALM
jgi:cullin-5